MFCHIVGVSFKFRNLVARDLIFHKIYIVSQLGLQKKVTSFAHAVMTADWALKAYKYTTMEADDMKKLAKNPLDALNKSNNRILKSSVMYRSDELLKII